MSPKSPKLSFNPKQAVKTILSALSTRSRDVIVGRYGLGAETKKLTLEAIGKKYGITRERVRQIENYSVQNIRKSKEYVKTKKYFDELKADMRAAGSIVAEYDFLNRISSDKSIQNHIHFLLVLHSCYLIILQIKGLLF